MNPRIAAVFQKFCREKWLKGAKIRKNYKSFMTVINFDKQYAKITEVLDTDYVEMKDRVGTVALIMEPRYLRVPITTSVDSLDALEEAGFVLVEHMVLQPKILITYRKFPDFYKKSIVVGYISQGFEFLQNLSDLGTIDGRPKKKIMISSCGEI